MLISMRRVDLPFWLPQRPCVLPFEDVAEGGTSSEASEQDMDRNFRYVEAALRDCFSGHLPWLLSPLCDRETA